MPELAKFNQYNKAVEQGMLQEAGTGICTALALEWIRIVLYNYQNATDSSENRMELLEKAFPELITKYNQYKDAANLIRLNKDKFNISEEETQTRAITLIGGSSDMPLISDFSDDKFKLLNLSLTDKSQKLPIRDIQQASTQVFKTNTAHMLMCQFSSGSTNAKHAIACCCFQGTNSKLLYIFDPNRGEYVVLNGVDFWSEVINTGKAYSQKHLFYDMIILQVEKKM